MLSTEDVRAPRAATRALAQDGELDGQRRIELDEVRDPRFNDVVELEQPDWAGDCNCSICRRYGVLWSYFVAKTVQTEASPTALARYSWGRKDLAFVHCNNCGCVMWWERVTPDPEKKMGVNLRMFDPAVLAAAQVEKLNGADD